MPYDCQDLITLFNKCFDVKYNTRLLRGDEEPVYLPADEHRPFHAVIFAHGFFSSALHECAHWFIAGEARRTLIDYGYWYIPDGRTAEQQSHFQKVEIKPQAIEWILSVAAGIKFHFSIDNLNGEETDSLAFKNSVYQQVLKYCLQGLPERASQFRDALCRFYGNCVNLNHEDFQLWN